MGYFYENGGYFIPDYMVNSIKRYLRQGIKPGGFLYAVLTNDFVNAVYRADKTNLANLPAYAYWLQTMCPREAWGSVEKVEAWIKKGGLSADTQGEA